MIRDIFLLLLVLFAPAILQADTPEDIVFRKGVRVVLRKHCSSCHNEADKKGGINLDNYDFVVHVIRRGELFRKVVEVVQDGSMPPSNRPAMSKADKDSLVIGINRILDAALSEPDPGQSVMRRLSHREYSYTIKDLIGVEFETSTYFPSEGSGGSGFDNHSRGLFMSPLLMERYYEAADSIVRMAQTKQDIWEGVVTKRYSAGAGRKVLSTLYKLVGKEMKPWNAPIKVARKNIIPFASRAYRRFLTKEEEDHLLDFFSQQYFENWRRRDAFDYAMAGVIKRILISPNFLYRTEANPPLEKPYPISNFELATRLSYLLWSSMPDQHLLDVAYRSNLHNPKVLKSETLRMMQDEKFIRFSSAFAPQWLGTEEILHSPNKDKEKFPSLTQTLCNDMHNEVVGYFSQVFSTNLLQLLDSDFTWLNENLARHYSIDGVKGDHFRRVPTQSTSRGGVLGMAAVLTTTSLPLRTSPVLRGQWILDRLLGERVPPPPADVPELEDASNEQLSALDLRGLLEVHRDDPACMGCHIKMDAFGLSMENFDALGRWRESYDTIPIDASGSLADGRDFNGPGELKNILISDKQKFAEAFSRSILSYALGRGIGFIDTRTIELLTNELIQNDFNGEKLMLALVTSYPFRHRRSDLASRYEAI